MQKIVFHSILMTCKIITSHQTSILINILYYNELCYRYNINNLIISL